MYPATKAWKGDDGYENSDLYRDLGSFAYRSMRL